MRPDRVGALGEFLLYHAMNLPVIIAKSSPDMGLQGVLSAVSEGRWNMWEIATGEIMASTRE